MNAKIAWGISMFVFLPMVTGCMQSAGVVRGQSPGYQAEYTAQPIQAVNHTSYVGHQAYHSCPTCQGGFPATGSLPFQHVLSHGTNGVGAGHGHHPTHYNWFSYEQPRNLVYPPANQPAAVIQYPYYTVKGPDDFFLQ